MAVHSTCVTQTYYGCLLMKRGEQCFPEVLMVNHLDPVTKTSKYIAGMQKFMSSMISTENEQLCGGLKWKCQSLKVHQ